MERERKDHISGAGRTEGFSGIFPYIVSPVGERGEILEEPLRRMVSHLIGCGVHGLTPLGEHGGILLPELGAETADCGDRAG